MTELEIRQGYSNGTLTDCDECGETMRAGSVCIACAAREEESSHAKPSQAVDDKQIDVHIWKNNEWVLLEGGLRNAKGSSCEQRIRSGSINRGKSLLYRRSL
jgi:hypothetical protein